MIRSGHLWLGNLDLSLGASSMGSIAETMVSAEIEPQPGRAQAAAIALQEFGFRILHIGQTISVEGPQALWHSTFSVSFETRKKRTMAEVEASEVTYQTALTEAMRIPEQLQTAISAVSFVEPPELF